VIGEAAIARDTAALVQVPSVTGDERAALERLGELAAALGLDAELHMHDLAALRAHPGHPGEEAARHELLGLTVTLPGSREGRVCLNGHVDVVAEGTAPWRHGPWSGAIADGHVHGRGSVDMKGGVVAALHALAALRAAGAVTPEVLLQCVPSEEDGGLGTFAALERDSDFAGCLIPEPTAFELICAQAGALTFAGVVPGKAAHAALRLEGESAIDRYVGFHLAVHEHERALNTDVAHPLMRAHELPYPLLVGRVAGGRWSSQVPDRLEFEGRLGVPIGMPVEEARAALNELAAEHGIELSWTGGQFAPADTDARHPFIRAVAAAAAEELGAEPPLTGATYGSDMRLWAERGIPCAMLGPGGIERAHGVDERVAEDEVVQTARILERVARAFGG
jgi:acetylornithine deacetylase